MDEYDKHCHLIKVSALKLKTIPFCIVSLRAEN